MRKLTLLLGAAIAVCGALGPPALPASAQAQPDRFDPRAAVEAIRKILRENYVVKERRAGLDAALARGLASGRYSVSDPRELAQRVTDDMAAVAHDKHLRLLHDPATAAQLAAGGQNNEVADSPFWREFARRRNHGVRELRVLDGNVRLMRYDGFLWTGEASAAALDSAMAFLRGGDAIVLDLRTNGGGSPEAVQRLASYFVPAGAKLVTFHMRDEAPSVSYAEAVPGGRIEGVPVYVLTSGDSASAAEEFASHVAGFGFGTLVGETTAGAAYRNELFPIAGGFALSVSVGRPELPAGGDWEGKGVAPKLQVSQELALERALEDALTRLAARAEGRERTEMEWAAALHAARVSGAAPALPAAAYVGRYGERTVSIEGMTLVYQRDGGRKTALVPLGGDLFALEANPRSRVRFPSTGGSIAGLVIERADGSRVEVPKT